VIRSTTVTFELGRRLQVAGTVQVGELRRAVADAVLNNRPFARALADASPTARVELERRSAAFPGDVPFDPALVRKVPPGFCAQLLVVPVRTDPRTGTVEAAAVDPRDPHLAAELSFHVDAPVRLLAAPLEEIERAAAQIERRRTGEMLAQRRPGLLVVEEEEVIVPLVRRPRPSLPPENQGPASALPPSLAPARRPSGLLPAARPEPVPAELPVPPSRAPLQMVVDFGALTRKARDEQAPATHRGAPPDPGARVYEPRMPPFPSLTPILEAIDGAPERDTLVAAIVRGVTTSARSAVLLAPRRGRFMGIGASYDLADVVRGATVPTSPLVDEAIAESERFGALDPVADRELGELLGLARDDLTPLLVHVAYVASKPALLLVAIGMGDPAEASRRGRVLATAAGGALTRFLKR